MTISVKKNKAKRVWKMPVRDRRPLLPCSGLDRAPPGNDSPTKLLGVHVFTAGVLVGSLLELAYFIGPVGREKSLLLRLGNYQHISSVRENTNKIPLLGV